jgi:tetratricopeptide (TPR) repeat protein
VGENDAQEKELFADFVENVRALLTRDSAGSNFYVILVPKPLACVTKDYHRANRILRKARGHFMIYGSARKRTVLDKPQYYLVLDGLIRHAPIPNEVSASLGKDFRQVLPEKTLIPENGSLFCFEVFSQVISISTHFMIGLAAFLSGDVVYAEKLFLSAEADLKSGKSPPGALSAIEKALPLQLKVLYQQWLVALYAAYLRSRDSRFLEHIDEIADKLIARDPMSHQALLIKAIASFELRKDVIGAKTLVNRCRNRQDSTWLFSLAFLEAYQGDLDSANDHYRQALKMPNENTTTAIQCEDFIQHVLDREPDKDHLYFCLGLINYNFKEDYEAAQRDFEKFISSPRASQYKEPLLLAHQLKEKCMDRLHPA